MAERDRLPVLIGTHRYLVDLKGYGREPVDATRQMVDQGQEPGEQSLSNQAIWKRTCEDFVLGAGQRFFDLEKDSVRSRYRYSFGLDPWKRRSLRMLRKPTNVLVNAATDQLLIQADGYIYHFAGLFGSRVNDPTANPWATTALTGMIGLARTCAASDGKYVYLGYGGGNPVRRVAGTVCAVWAGAGIFADVLGYANGRLLAGYANELFELGNAGAKTTIYTHFNTSFAWSAIAGAPNGIYCAGNNGRHGEVYLCTVIDQTGAINAPFHACSLPEGENINTLKWYGGVVILGTSKGVRIAQITGSGFLAYGPLIQPGGVAKQNWLNASIDNAVTSFDLRDNVDAYLPVAGSYLTVDGEMMLVTGQIATTSTVTRGVLGTSAASHSADAPVVIDMPLVGVTGLEAQGQYVWFTWKNPDPYHTGLGRIDLSRFVGDLLPAYAEDLMCPFSNGTPATPTTWVDGANTGRDFRAYILQGSGVFMETNQYGTAGTYLSGAITYGTPERKAFVSVEVWTKPLPAGATVTAILRLPDGSKVTPTPSVMNTTNATYMKCVFPANTESEWGELQLTFTPSTDGYATPEVERWTMRAVPLATRASKIQLPIHLTSFVDDDGGKIGQDPWTEFNYLNNLYTNRTRVPFQMGNETATVLVDGINIQPGDRIDEAIEWTRERDWIESTVYVTLLTVDGGS